MPVVPVPIMVPMFFVAVTPPIPVVVTATVFSDHATTAEGNRRCEQQ